MESVIVFIVVFVIVFGIMMIAFFIGRARSKSIKKRYQAYLLQQFPHLQGQDFLLANQVSKKLNPTIAMIDDPVNKNIIIVFEPSKGTFQHVVYPIKSLKTVNRSYQILSRGALPKTYSYEEALALTFEDGKTYLFILENISNQYGNDKGADFVRNIMAPWEQKLKAQIS
jgi:hypothetical protein